MKYIKNVWGKKIKMDAVDKTYERPREIQRQKNTILTQENQKELSGFGGYQTFFEAGIRMNTNTPYRNTT